MKLVQPLPIYLVLTLNHMKLTRLDSGKSVSKTSVEPFSNARMVLADFEAAEGFLKQLLQDLIPPTFGFSKSLHVLIQQTERIEDGLSSVEHRALIDLCQHAGAVKVIVLAQKKLLSNAEVLKRL